MSDLVVNSKNVAAVEIESQVTLPAGEDIAAGQVVRLDVSTGFATLANATTPAEGRVIGVAINSAQLGKAVTVVRKGVVGLGDALDSATIDNVLYLSDTDGKIDDGAGSPTANYGIGRVFPIFGTVAGDKVLAVDVPLF